MASSTTTIDQMQAPSYDTSPQNIALAKQEFEALLGHQSVLSDPAQCHARSSSSWMPVPLDQRPNLVLLPQSTEDVSAIMRICHARRIPVTAYSGGTSLPGALVCTRGGVCVDFQKMAKILCVHKEDMDAVVQPGVRWRELDTRLEEEGFFFPPDPALDACIGGMVTMSCAGTNAYRYGTMKEWVISLTAVLADGTIIKTKQRPRKSSAGYDLTHLLIGSEGTLGLVTEAIIKVAARPKNQHVAVATFPGLQKAAKTGLALVNSGMLLDAVELLDHVSVKAINVSGLSSIHWDELPTVFLKTSGSQNSVADSLAAIEKTAKAHDCQSFEATGDRERMDVLWNARKIDGKAALAMKKDPSDIALLGDAAVPISRVADLMEASHRLMNVPEVTGSITAHIGDGNLHVKLICPARLKAETEAILQKVDRLAVEMEGTVSGEHGIGLKLRDQLVHELGNDTIDAMRSIKLSLDPLCILNPDKVFRI